MSNIDWSSAPDWATKHGIVGTCECPIWFNDTQYTYCDEQQEGKVFRFSDGCVYKPKEIYAITERPAPPWSGEGLPPVGCACEVTPHNTVWGFSVVDTYGCTVLAYHDEFVWVDIGTPGVPVATRIDKVDFSPIRTPSQIAAELRTTTIKRAAELCPYPRADSTLVVLEALYDNGLLKGATDV